MTYDPFFECSDEAGQSSELGFVAVGNSGERHEAQCPHKPSVVVPSRLVELDLLALDAGDEGPVEGDHERGECGGDQEEQPVRQGEDDDEARNQDDRGREFAEDHRERVANSVGFVGHQVEQVVLTTPPEFFNR